MKEKINCLLVDDDSDDREIFLMVLEMISEDIHCQTAGNGIDAIGLLSAGSSPDVMFLDINMPKMNGLDCLAKIRAEGLLKDCRVFMYSTTAEAKVLERSQALDAEFIVKPVSVSVLKETLSEIFNHI